MKLEHVQTSDISGILELISVDLADFGRDDDELHEDYDQMLDECCSCETCNKQGSDLKDDDPIAYRCGFSDWLDAELSDGRYCEIDDYYFTEEQAEELKDEIISQIENLF
jgi:hypothetical protein